MLSLNTLRRFRPSVVSQAISDIQMTTARRGAPLFSTCFRGVGGKQLHVVRRTFLDRENKVQSHCPSSHFSSAHASSKDGNLIYTGSLGSAVRWVKMFSYSTSGTSLLLMPHILLNTGLGVQSFAMQAAFCGVIGFFTFLTPVLLHLISKGYVVRLYHHPDEDIYTAITYSVFLMEKKNIFHQSEVKIPAISKMFSTFYVNNMGLLVNPDLFMVPHDYNHLMGYDKPFSFNTDDMDRPERS